jgi:hypothetical protein
LASCISSQIYCVHALFGHFLTTRYRKVFDAPISYHFSDVSNKQTIDTKDRLDGDVRVKNKSQNVGLMKVAQWLKVNFANAQNSQVLEVDYAMLDSHHFGFVRETMTAIVTVPIELVSILI